MSLPLRMQLNFVLTAKRQWLLNLCSACQPKITLGQLMHNSTLTDRVCMCARVLKPPCVCLQQCTVCNNNVCCTRPAYHHALFFCACECSHTLWRLMVSSDFPALCIALLFSVLPRSLRLIRGNMSEGFTTSLQGLLGYHSDGLVWEKHSALWRTSELLKNGKTRLKEEREEDWESRI